MSLGPRTAQYLYDHRRPLLLALALVALAGAGATLVVPGADLAGADTARLFVVLAGLAAGAAGVWTVVEMVGEGDGPQRRRTDPFDRVPEHVEVGVDELVGTEIDESLDRYQSLRGWRRQRTIRTIRERLGTTVIDTIVDLDGVDRATATDRLADGSWTDDDRAAALFAEPGAIQRSVDERVADWARGDRFGRRVEAVIDELRRRHAPRRRTPIEHLDGDRTEPRTAAIHLRSADDVADGGTDDASDGTSDPEASGRTAAETDRAAVSNDGGIASTGVEP